MVRSPDEANPQLTGRKLGEFLVGELIGSGGFAHVYRARQPSLGRDAVIKVLRPGVARTPRHVQMFEREAKLASQLDHPYAAHVYAFAAEPDGLLWIAMELVRGTTLAEWLEIHGPIAIGRFVPLFERVCEVVQTAHAAGLIHRDIKPSNIMVITRAGRLMPKLLDFGIATLLDGEPPVLPAAAADPTLDDATQPGGEATTQPDRTEQDLRGSGTPAYMAPEQWQRGRHDHRVDIYALGVVAFRCLTGRAPFEGRSPRELYAAHAREPVPPLGAGWSGAFDAVIGKALAKDPRERYGTALELASGLAAAASDSERASGIGRDDARPWLASAPPHLAACVSAVATASTPREVRDATHGLVDALAEWIGVVALAARASIGVHTDELPVIAKLRREPLAARDWLELGRALCAPYFDRDELFPIPELVRWFAEDTDETLGPDALLALLALTRGDAAAFPREVLGHVLRGLAFLHGYTLLAGDIEWTAATHGRVRAHDAIWISDGDRNRLFELAPVVAALAPAPGEPLELFALAGGGRVGAKLVARPYGFEHETATVWPWLTEHFAAAPAARQVTHTDRPPYRGLETFSADDAELFFGRDRQVEALFNRMLSQPFVALTGPSGSGKSSVVLAGLIPRLPPDWVSVVVRPGRHPLLALDAALARVSGEERRLLLVVDQAEELLTIADRETESAEFTSRLSRLLAAHGDTIRILVTIRDDFIGRADELPAWRDLIGHNLVLLTVPSRDDLAEMVVRPAAQAGYGFDDPQLIADMVDEVADRPGALPLLSFAASRLWEARDPATQQLTRASYVAMGGVGGALARYAEDTLSALTPRQQAIARVLFRHLVSAHGTKAPARRAELVTITEGADLVLEHLIAARILVAGEGADDDVTVAHEALIDRWPRLIQWRAEDAAGAHHRDELRAAAALWHQHRRDASYLWRGRALATFDEWAERWAGSLTATEAAFGDASRRAAARARRTRRAVIGGSVAVLSLAVIVLWSLNRAATHARAQAETRLTDVLADRGRSELLAGQPLRALVYLTSAFERGRDGVGMRVGLAQAARAVDRQLDRVTAHHGPMNMAMVGSLVVSYATNEPARAWRLEGGKLQPGVTFAHEGAYGDYTIALAASGDLIASGTYQDGRIRTWDSKGTLLGTSDPGRSVNLGLMISPAGDQIASSWGNVVALWDRQARPLGLLGELDDAARRFPSAIAYDHDGQMLAVAFTDGVLQVWRVDRRALVSSTDLGERPVMMHVAGDRIFISTTSGAVLVLAMPSGKLVYRVAAHASDAHVAVAPDGTTFATVSNDTEAKIWRASDGSRVATLVHALPVSGLVYGPDSRTVITAGAHSVLTLWDAEHGAMLGHLDAGADVVNANFSADGKTIVTAVADGRIETWDSEPDAIVSAFWGHKGSVWSAAWSPDGKTIATVGRDGAIRSWRSSSGEQIGELRADTALGTTDSLNRIAFSPDGTQLAGPFARDVAVWDVKRGLQIAYLNVNESTMSTLAFDRNGRLAIGANLREDAPYGISIWNVATERIEAHLAVAGTARDLAFDPTGDRLITSTDEGVQLWDITANRVLWRAPGSEIFDVDYSRDGALVTGSSSDGFVRIWRADTGEEYRVLKQASSRVWSVAFSPDGTLLAAACGDNRIYIWDIEAGAIAAVVAGHQGFVTSLAFSPDGTKLASTGTDGRAFVWSLARETRSPEQLERLIGERAPFHLEGVELVVAGQK